MLLKEEAAFVQGRVEALLKEGLSPSFKSVSRQVAQDFCWEFGKNAHPRGFYRRVVKTAKNLGIRALNAKEDPVAMNEACAVWIEQRIKEELETKPGNGKSLRTIGKEIAEEIERIFQTKVNPQTIVTKAFRQQQGVSNETPDENPPQPGDEGGDNGDNSLELTPQEVVTHTYIIEKRPTVESYLQMLESLYNRKSADPQPLAHLAKVATVKRSPLYKKKNATGAKQ